MFKRRYEFASDNTSGATPEALAAMITANQGWAGGYGADHVSAEAAELVRAALDVDAEIRFLASGTAANALACSMLCRPFESVLSYADAHICVDETGAPGFFGHGLNVAPLQGSLGRISLQSLSSTLGTPECADVQPPAALSVTNATEYGTVYSVDLIRPLADEAERHGLKMHLDGARLANAAAAGFDLKAIKRLGFDIVVMGGTKSGMPLSEALVVLNPSLAPRLSARLKQAGQLFSKGRFLAAPWIGALKDGAWLRRASHANAMARRLADALPFPIAYPVEANAVFVKMGEAAHARLLEIGWQVFRFPDGSVRFMCSWATTESLMDELLSDLSRMDI